MKKILSSVLLFLGLSLIASAENTDKFMENFSSCSPYSESHITEMFGMNVSSSLEILGRSGGKCAFRSSIKTPDAKADISCKFTDNQIEEMITSMQNNASKIEAYAAQGLEAGSGIMDNPAVMIFNKYLNDTDVCNVTNQ